MLSQKAFNLFTHLNLNTAIVFQGGRSLPQQIQLLPQRKMTVHIEFDIPVYRDDRYERLERSGRIKVSSNIETLEEGQLTQEYNRLKKETDILIADLNARTRLADEVSKLEDEIRWKSNKLKDLLGDIEKATQHYDALKVVLEKLGINPRAFNLTFSNQLLLSESGANVAVTPTEVYPDF